METLRSQTPKLALSSVWGFTEHQAAKQTYVSQESVIRKYILQCFFAAFGEVFDEA